MQIIHCADRYLAGRTGDVKNSFPFQICQYERANCLGARNLLFRRGWESRSLAALDFITTTAPNAESE